MQKQIPLMALVFSLLAAVYFSPVKQTLLLISAAITLLFPIQLILWRISMSNKWKDFFFCFTLLILLAILKHLWVYADMLFYIAALLVGAVLHYPVFLAVASAAMVLELLRENIYGGENAQDILFRYILFVIAGSLTFMLLREEKKKKEEFKKELEDLKYGIHQMEKEAPVALLSDEGQTSRNLDAALVLDESVKNVLNLIYNIFKPNAVILWQYLAGREQLRIRNRVGPQKDLKEKETVSLGEGPIGWAGLNRKIFLQQDRSEGIPVPYYKKKIGIKSFLAVPVLDDGKLEGVLTLDSEHLNYFSSEAESALKSFSAQIAEMIRMARLAKEREERAFEFQAFYHASRQLSSIIDFQEIVYKLSELCSEIVPSDYAAIVIAGNEKNAFAVYEWSPSEPPQVKSDVLNMGETWVSWFLQNREEPLILSGSQRELQGMAFLSKDNDIPEFGSYLAIPMRHQHNCIGAVILASEQKDVFTSHQARILSILCNQAAVSLENASIIGKMEELAITDGLTSLFNHRYFQQSFDREIERAERLQENMSLLLMDIDHFKSFNDSFGHPAGDFVLKSLGDLLRSNARKIDILARYGGEEFAAILPGVNAKNGRKTAERWRKAVQRASFKWENKSFAVTLSIGVATYPEDAGSKDALLEKADRALYDAKENGRNQVRHWRDNEEKKFSLFG